MAARLHIVLPVSTPSARHILEANRRCPADLERARLHPSAHSDLPAIRWSAVPAGLRINASLIIKPANLRNIVHEKWPGALGFQKGDIDGIGLISW
ncbi:hypothetical protein [Labrys miyagiensis]